MAYADANTSTRKLSATVAVIALEAGLVWALVTGLAYTRTVVRDRGVDGVFIPSPTPTATPPPPDPTHTPEAPRVVPDPRFTLGPKPSDGPSTVPSPAPSSTGDTGTIWDPPASGTATPTPTPSVSPRTVVRPVSAKPRGDSSKWLGPDDYPLRSLRNGDEGRTAYRLSIDAAGRVTGCTITAPSGHAELDATACKLLPKRARFDPARDETGAATAGVFSGAVLWRLPAEL